METVVVSPDGTVYRNDDRNGALDRRPLVKIASAPKNGWCTVRVAEFTGDPVETNIVLLYGRYNAGNPNCASPTVPAALGGFDALAEGDDAGKDSTNEVPPPRPGHPGSDRRVTAFFRRTYGAGAGSILRIAPAFSLVAT